ncbi:argonaute/piwi family protein [Gimesia sp.]|uniref:argonaute/piwi family protein n=1 Tax=Gimesia sp. TaxID=2024833 RepID=UPI003A90924E
MSEHLWFAANLVQNALLQMLLKLPREVFRFEPLCFLADFEKENFLAQSTPNGIVCPDWLGVCPSFELSVRKFGFERDRQLLGVAIGVRTKKRIDRNCNLLIDDGLNLIGRYVGVHKPASDSRIRPKLSLVGRVEHVKGDALTLTDLNEHDRDTVSSSEVWLERSWTNFNDCIALAYSDQAPHVQNRLEQLLASFRSGPSRRAKFESIANYLGQQSLNLVPGVSFSLGSLMGSKQHPLPTIRNAPKPVYVFDPAGGSTDIWHDRGLNSFGPYTSQIFTPTQPRICVVCQSRRKGRVEQFIHKLLRGISPPNSKKTPPFAAGFIRKYALDDASIFFFETEGDSADQYKRAVHKALMSQNDGQKKWDLALVQTEDSFHQLHGDENPYLVSKVEFLTHQIPVQEFEIETAELPDTRIGYALNNMALATYSKLGGIPWLLKANPTIAHELVIGLGSAESGTSRLGGSERVVGITTVFTGEGNYCLSNVSQAVPYDDYQQTLLVSLKKTMIELARSMNWQKGEHVRLVFHAFKPFKDAEAEAVKSIVESLGEYDVEFAFLHVVEDHPFLLFDNAQRGVRDFETGGTKGVLAPDRGHFLRMSGHEVLLTLTGARDVKRATDGIPRPVLLRLGRNSTFHDMTYLTRQVYTFSSHSWRSFFPSPLPVTILYSELIAKLLGNLGTVSHWNPSVMLGRIGGTRWFL